MRITQLKNKLLLGVLTIEILLTLTSMLAVSWVIRHQYLEQSNALLYRASKMIDNNLSDHKNNQLIASRQLAEEENIDNLIWYLSQHEQASVDRNSLTDAYQQLAKNAYKLGRSTDIDQASIYDNDGKLISFVKFKGNSASVGFVERFSTPVFRVAELNGASVNFSEKSLRSIAHISQADLKIGRPMPHQEGSRYVVKDGEIAIESYVPVIRMVFNPSVGRQEINQLGLVVTVQLLNQAFIDNLSRLTDTNIHIFAISDGLGVYDAEDRLDSEWASIPTSLSDNTKKPALNELMIEGNGYYQRLMPIYSGNRHIGTIVALHSKDAVQKNIKEMIQMLGLISAVSLLLVLPIVWYFSTTISNPLSMLCHIFRGVANGQQKTILNEELRYLEKARCRHDELGDLTQSFIAMNAAVNRKIERINEINASLELKVQERTVELERLALYDNLTGIPNRVLLADRMLYAVSRARRENTMLCVCYLDLDGFKPVNDALGHQAGDQVLIEIAQRISGIIRETDTVARLGGDEFVILMPGLSSEKKCLKVVNRILDAISKPIAIEDRSFILTGSVGLSILHGGRGDADADSLLLHADKAMYMAKQAGKNRYHLFDPAHDLAV